MGGGRLRRQDAAVMRDLRMGEDLMVQLLDLRAQSFNNERRRLNEQLHAVRTLLLNMNSGVTMGCAKR